MGARVSWPLHARIEVEWDDATVLGGWETVARYRASHDLAPVRTIGYLVEQTRTHLMLAQSQNGLNQEITDTTTIPRSSVRRMRRLPAWPRTRVRR